jgi:hypothetical protein
MSQKERDAFVSGAYFGLLSAEMSREKAESEALRRYPDETPAPPEAARRSGDRT